MKFQKASRTDLPRYNKPPVVEVAIGVQFEPLTAMKTAHYGFFGKIIEDQYPSTEDQSPLVDTTQPELLETPPLRRVWYASEKKIYLMQVQPDRFIHNWRKTEASDSYPSFAKAKEMFYGGWSAFEEFARTARLGKLRLKKYEITYVNHIALPKKAFASVAENYFPLFRWSTARSAKYLPDPNSVSLNLSFQFPEDEGLLIVVLRHGLRTADSAEVMQVDLTARGPLSPDGNNFDTGLELGHERIVRGFTDLTSKAAHAEWERIQ